MRKHGTSPKRRLDEVSRGIGKTPSEWPAITRRFIAAPKLEILQLAIESAKAAGEDEITRLLKAHADNNFALISRLSDKVVKQLVLRHRTDEVLTLKLLDASINAKMVSGLNGFPFDEGVEKFEESLKACLGGIEVSRKLKDKPCEAIFLLVSATGFYNLRKYAEAEVHFTRATEIYRELYAADFRTYATHLANTLNNFAVVLRDTGRLNKAKDFYLEALKINRKLADIDPDLYLPNTATTLNFLGVLLDQANEFREAEQVYTEALKIRAGLAAKSKVYLPAWADTLNNLAVFKSRLSKVVEAEDHYLRALKIYRKLSRGKSLDYAEEAAKVLNNLATLRIRAGNLKAAEKNGTEALRIYRELAALNQQTYTAGLTIALNNLAIIKRTLNNFSEAEALGREALDKRRKLAKLNSNVYLPPLAMTLNNLGVLQSYLNHFAEARKYLTEALRIRKKLEKARPGSQLPQLAMTLNNLGALFENEISVEKAEKYYSDALAIYRALAKANPEVYLPEAAKTLNNLAVLQRNINNFEAAENYYNEALQNRTWLAKRNPGNYLYQLSETLNNLGVLHTDLNQPETAENLYIESLKIRKELAAKNPAAFSNVLADTLNNLGLLKSGENEFRKAEKYFIDSAEIYRRLAKVTPHLYLPDVAATGTNLGVMYDKMERFGEAQALYKEALEIWKDLSKINPHAYLPSVAGTLNNLGQSYTAARNYKAALKYFTEARKIITSLRSNLVDINRRKYLFQKYNSIYRGMLTCYAGLRRWTKAIEITEAGKSASVNDLIGLEMLRPTPPVNATPENRAKLDQAFQNYARVIKTSQATESLLARYFKELGDLDVDSETGSLQKSNLEKARKKAEKDLFNLRNRRESLLKAIRRFDPNYPPGVKDLNFGQIMDVSQNSAHAIIMFRVLTDETFIFAIFPDRTYKHLRIEDFTDRDLNEVFLTSAEGPAFRSRRRKAFREDAATFGVVSELLGKIEQKLIGPVRRMLRSKRITNVLFVPNGKLAVLPLHACFDETAKSYLVTEFNVKFSTNVSLFRRSLNNHRKHKISDRLMFVTNPTNSGKYLHFAEKEVESICRIYGLDYSSYEHNLLNDRATLREVRDRLSQNFEIVHFACHGSYNWNDPFSSRLRLAQNKGLPLREILQTKMSRSKLIVLSACRTGIVNTSDASDEHYGFPFAFMLTGSSSVWATLWQIDDEATSILLETAYRHLRAGVEASEALRRSQVEMSQSAKYSSPYYWAAFQHFGR